MKHLRVRIPGKIVEIPYLHFKGKKGPICVISGGIHGDEVNGIVLVKRFIEFCHKNEIEKNLAGELIIIPIMNPSGFEAHKRYITEDKRDLNRSFNKSGKTASYCIARALEKHFYKKADIAIDCHDSGKRAILLPHARVPRFEEQSCRRCAHAMARAFGSKIIIERKGKKGMLAVEMERKHQLPVLTVEVGGALKIADKFLNQALKGIINILRDNSFLSGEVKIPQKQYYLKDRFGVPAKISGVITFTKKLGQRVHKGDKIGTLYIPKRAKSIDLVSPMCGLIFSMQYIAVVTKGEIIYSILEDKKCHVRRRTTSMFEEVKNMRM